MTDIIATVSTNPVAVLVDEKVYSDFYTHMKAECDAFVPDLSTVTSRAKISAQAYKVTRTKTAIDAAGKKLNEDARAKIDAVDAQRRKIRAELDALADDVRKPLAEWEAAEKDRADKVKAIRENVISLGNSAPSDDSQEIRDRLTALTEIELDPEVLREQFDEIAAQKQESHDHLSAHLIRAEKAEADAAELAKLRAEAEDRARIESERAAAEAAAKEAAERDARAKAEYEASVKRQAEAAERAQKEAIERERQAAETARIEAERAAKAARDRIESEAAERVAKAEAEALAVREKAEREERDRLDAIEKTKREEEARHADRAHRSAVMKAAKEAIMSQGADEETAKKIVLAIVAGEVPNVRMNF